MKKSYNRNHVFRRLRILLCFTILISCCIEKNAFAQVSVPVAPKCECPLDGNESAIKDAIKDILLTTEQTVIDSFLSTFYPGYSGVPSDATIDRMIYYPTYSTKCKDAEPNADSTEWLCESNCKKVYHVYFTIEVVVTEDATGLTATNSYSGNKYVSLETSCDKGANNKYLPENEIKASTQPALPYDESIKQLIMPFHETTVSIYPNPVSKQQKELFISAFMKETERTTIEVCDITGKKITPDLKYALTKGNNQIKIDINNFATGNYIVKLTTNTYQIIKRISIVE